MLLFLLLFCGSVGAQVTDASFFTDVRSVNPGVVHMRRVGVVALDMGKKAIKRTHNVDIGQFVTGIDTDMNITETKMFLATAARFLSTEFLVDRESGKLKQSTYSPQLGNSRTNDDARSDFYGAVLDFRFFGVSYSGASYDYSNKFRVGTPPNFTAHDEEKKLNYSNLKIGSAIKIGVLRVGGFFSSIRSQGKFNYTAYDTTTGAEGATSSTDVKTDSKGFGAGVGMTLQKFRTEVSLERMYESKLTIDENYPGNVIKPEVSSRATALAEAKLFSFLYVGFRYRQIKGNFIDLDDILTSNLLYENVSMNDIRTESSITFSFGEDLGFSPSAFFTQSTVTTSEKSPVFDNGNKFKAVTISQAYGVTLSYRF